MSTIDPSNTKLLSKIIAPTFDIRVNERVPLLKLQIKNDTEETKIVVYTIGSTLIFLRSDTYEIVKMFLLPLCPINLSRCQLTNTIYCLNNSGDYCSVSFTIHVNETNFLSIDLVLKNQKLVSGETYHGILASGDTGLIYSPFKRNAAILIDSTSGSIKDSTLGRLREGLLFAELVSDRVFFFSGTQTTVYLLYVHNESCTVTPMTVSVPPQCLLVGEDRKDKVSFVPKYPRKFSLGNTHFLLFSSSFFSLNVLKVKCVDESSDEKKSGICKVIYEEISKFKTSIKRIYDICLLKDFHSHESSGCPEALQDTLVFAVCGLSSEVEIFALNNKFEVVSSILLNPYMALNWEEEDEKASKMNRLFGLFRSEKYLCIINRDGGLFRYPLLECLSKLLELKSKSVCSPSSGKQNLVTSLVPSEKVLMNRDLNTIVALKPSDSSEGSYAPFEELKVPSSEGLDAALEDLPFQYNGKANPINRVSSLGGLNRLSSLSHLSIGLSPHYRFFDGYELLGFKTNFVHLLTLAESIDVQANLGLPSYLVDAISLTGLQTLNSMRASGSSEADTELVALWDMDCLSITAIRKKSLSTKSSTSSTASELSTKPSMGSERDTLNSSEASSESEEKDVSSVLLSSQMASITAAASFSTLPFAVFLAGKDGKKSSKKSPFLLASRAIPASLYADLLEASPGFSLNNDLSLEELDLAVNLLVSTNLPGASCTALRVFQKDSVEFLAVGHEDGSVSVGRPRFDNDRITFSFTNCSVRPEPVTRLCENEEATKLAVLNGNFVSSVKIGLGEKGQVELKKIGIPAKTEYNTCKEISFLEGHLLVFGQNSTLEVWKDFDKRMGLGGKTALETGMQIKKIERVGRRKWLVLSKNGMLGEFLLE